MSSSFPGYNLVCSLRSQLLLALLLLSLAGSCFAQEKRVGVIYPDVRAPFLSIFTDIIKGVESKVNSDVISLAMPREQSPSDIDNWISENRITHLVALGRRGAQVSQSIESDIPVTVGAITMSRELIESKTSGIVLDPNPSRLFESLRKFSPETKRIFIVYHEEKSGWLLEASRAAAKEYGFEIVSTGVTSLAGSLQAYTKLFKGKLTRNDAVWLLNDPNIIETRTILPFILKESWNQNVILISSSAQHVKRGALLAVYPDNYKMGQSLAAQLEKIKTDNVFFGGYTGNIQLLDDVKVAANLRTAEHLGLVKVRELRSEIDLVLPSR